MKSRWCLGALIIILTFLGGIAGHQQNTQHNQFIVFQFSAETLDHQNYSELVCDVKEQLQVLGAENIEVVENKDGSLVLKYFFDNDADIIRSSLSKDDLIDNKIITSFADNPQETPSNKILEFDFDVYEIEDDNGFESALGNKGLLSIKSDIHRYSPSNEPFSIITFELDIDSRLISSKIKCQSNIDIHSNNVLQIIPEVRAGPSKRVFEDLI